MDHAPVTVCFFGHYSPNYSRNRILQKAMRRAGLRVVEIHSDARQLTRWKQLFRVSRHAPPFDVLWVGFPGHSDMPLAKLIGQWRGVPLIFDAFVSRYNTSVEDRQTVSPHSWAARRLRWSDTVACRLADLVVTDTQAHARYFNEHFGIPSEKFRRVFLGADDEIMQPQPQITPPSEFTVFFYGSFIPLQGADVIVRAAHWLEQRGETIRFILLGSGQTFSQTRQLAESLGVRSVHFMGRVPYEKLPRLISQAHVNLGIFGNTPKTQLVIPNKVYDGLAVGRPIITADTPAIREILTHGETAYLCPPNSPEALAHAILTLRDDTTLRTRLAQNGLALFRERLSLVSLSKHLAALLREVIQR